jgi:hypothetical protein
MEQCCYLEDRQTYQHVRLKLRDRVNDVDLLHGRIVSVARGLFERELKVA